MQTSEGALILSPKDSRRDPVPHSTIEMNVVGQVLFLTDRTQIPLSPPLFFYQFSFFSVFLLLLRRKSIQPFFLFRDDHVLKAHCTYFSQLHLLPHIDASAALPGSRKVLYLQ